MKEEEAKQRIQETFEAAFDEERFAQFISRLLNHKPKYVQESPMHYVNAKEYQSHIDLKNTKTICQYTTKDDKNIDALIVPLKQETSLTRARVRQRNFIARYLEHNHKDAALVAYVVPDQQDWRFSFIAAHYEPAQTPTGRTTARRVLTSARRFSFLVGENEGSHTAQERLAPILCNEKDIALEELQEAFSVEEVNKEFFGLYRRLFLKLHDALQQDGKTRTYCEDQKIDTVNFIKKLLGQIVFLYFIQKKGWLGVAEGADWGTGSKNFLRELFESIKKESDHFNFFKKKLELLFYDALNQRPPHKWSEQLNCKVPFLNGGLFEPMENYDWKEPHIRLPDDLFSNKTEAFIGDGVLDIFDRFNFTVKEDDPLDKEVAIDPELLGSIYEKFNAINKDNFEEYKKAIKQGNEAKFNKAHGVYYTPRVVVHYMCQQSLINYLKTKCPGLSNDDLTHLIEHGSGNIEEEQPDAKLPEKILSQRKKLDEALKNIKVCDPAIGSGAFPVSMMEEIVKARLNLAADLPLETVEQKDHYAFKRHCIENCLYGVDRDPGAVEIARLRLWLSLVVDEEDIHDIKPLPNLDYMVVRANAILQLEDTLFSENDRKNIEQLKEEFKNETKVARKNEIRQMIREKFLKREFSFSVYFSEVFRKNGEFDKNGGFDLVITNPPYLREQKYKQIFEPVNNSPFGKKYHQGKMNYWYYFLHKAMDITKENGIIAFITSSYWLKSYGARKLIERVKANLSFIQILNFDNLKVFEEVLGRHMIAIYKKGQQDSFRYAKTLNIDNLHSLEINLKKTTSDKYIQRKEFLNEEIFTKDGYIVLAKPFLIKHPGTRLLRAITRISDGIVYARDRLFQQHINELSGKNNAQFNVGDGVFVLSKEEVDRLSPSKEEKEVLKKYLRPKDVRRYKVEFSDQYLIYSDRFVTRQIAEFPEFKRLKKHLDKYREFQFMKSAHEYYGMMRPRKTEYFEGPKIIFKTMLDHGASVLDVKNKYYINLSCLSIIPLDPKYDLKYILAILNSKLARLWFHIYGKNRGFSVEVGVERLRKLPIMDIEADKQQELIRLVDTRMSLEDPHQQATNTQDIAAKENEAKKIEDEIDQIVYKLYGVKEEYIKERWEDLGHKWE